MRERQTVSILIIIGDDPVCSVCSVVNKRHQRSSLNISVISVPKRMKTEVRQHCPLQVLFRKTYRG